MTTWRQAKRLWPILLLCWLGPAIGIAAETPLPFAPGEKLTFQLRWGLVPAGITTLMVAPTEERDGVRVQHLVMIAETNNFVDMFYKVRDRIDSYTSDDVSYSLLYHNNQREGHSRRDVVVNFDWDKMQAVFSNFNEKNAPITIGPGTLDPLASFYYTRTLDLQPGQVYQRPLTDGKKAVMSQVRVLAEEEVTVPAGTFKTIRFEPDLSDAGGVFEKSKNARMTVWVTADRRHIPVKITSKVVVGHFTGELISMEGVQALPANP